MNDPGQTAEWTALRDNELPKSPWVSEEFTAVEDRPAVDRATGLVSLAFIKSALRRRSRLWCTTAAIGLLLGVGLYVKYPPAYKATTSVLLAESSSQQSNAPIQTDAALAQSRTVAASVVRQLGLRQSVGSFLASYTVTPVTDQVLLFTVGAPSYSDALQRATALAADFLQFRVTYLRDQQQQAAAALGRQLNQAQQHLDSIDRQISDLSAQPSSAGQQATLSRLQAERLDAVNTVGQVQQYVTGAVATSQTQTTSMVQGSRLLDAPAPVARSHVKAPLTDVVGGLIGGLAIGMGIVIVGALTSDRLRRRDDIADTMGAPVRLSVRIMRKNNRMPRLPWRASVWNHDMARIVADLRRAVPERSLGGPASLALVAVDNAPCVARALVSLALSLARQGKKVVVADLASNMPAARLLGTKHRGVSPVNSKGTHLTVAIPDRDDIVPIGPRASGISVTADAQASEELGTAYAATDVLLTLITLDPAIGGDHLATWASDVVAVVTAGRSSGTKIYAVGEMIRLAGTRLVSVVLIGADKDDESLGVPHTVDQPFPV